jgi:hypothetical protein
VEEADRRSLEERREAIASGELEGLTLQEAEHEVMDATEVPQSETELHDMEEEDR